MKIPESHADILAKKSFANLATVMPDGTPQVSPVWVDYDGTHIVINSAKGRQKDRNVERNPHIALSVSDPDDPYRHLQVRGRVVAIETEGAVDHIHRMAKKYLGTDTYPWLTEAEVRVIYLVEPDKVYVEG
jgi:PPOX class probable F420-dependent enzyme